MKETPQIQAKRKIFCIGLGRTGTTSLHEAFQALGLRSRHFPYSLLDDPFGEELAQADAFSDLPIPLYFEAYAERFADARFILTTRSEDSWLQSVEWLLANGSKIWGGHDSTWQPGGVVERAHMRVFGTERFEPEKMLAVYRAHNAAVLDFFANDSRFLHLELEDTLRFEQLADFIGVDTDLRGPLPRANRRWRPLPALIQKIAYRLGFGR